MADVAFAHTMLVARASAILECTCAITRRARNRAVVSATSAIAIVELDARSLVAVCLVGGGVDDVPSMCDR